MMAIEMAPKAPPAPAPQSSSADGSSKSGTTAQANSKVGKSFLSILGLVDMPSPPTMDASSSAQALDTATASLTGATDGGPAGTCDAISQTTLGGGLDPSALLAQLQLAPLKASAPQPESVAAAAVSGGKQPHPRGGDTRAELTSGMDGAASKQAKAAVKSGKAVLDAAAGAANAAAADNGEPKLTSGTQSAEGKFALPESVVKAVREVAATLVKAPEVSTVALAGNREKAQDGQAFHKVPVSDVVVGVPTGTGGAMVVDGVVANSGAAGVDAQFAEQVSYWMGGDVKKAELTLDGFGKDPVEVSISMQGNEAHVAFRTDEAQTRDALANASVELKASLDRQGVLLSGVSVGTASAGGAGDQSQQQSGGKSSGWRSAKVEAAPQGSTPSARPVATASNRSIDLFV